MIRPERAAPSLRRQLLAPLVWVWLLGMAAASLGAYSLANRSANAAFDRSLQDEASALASKVVWSDRGPLLNWARQSLELPGWDSRERNGFVVVDERGRVLGGDADVPRPSLRHHSFGQPQLFDARYRQQAVRGALFSLASPMLDHSVSIVVVETRNKRAQLVRDVLLTTAVPLLGLGALTFVLLGWGVRRGLQPLREVAREVAQRAPSDLSALPIDRVPAEARPLIERINSLLAEVQDSIALQRRFVADAAHQLRTPVAGLRVLTQELAIELGHLPASAGAPSAALLDALLKSGDRLARLIGQLLSLVRSQGSLSLEGEVSRMDIRPLLREAAEPLALRAAREGRRLQLELPDTPVLARAHKFWLGEALANALDNALRYGGPDIRVRVLPDSTGLGCCIDIEDDGPGVPAADLTRLAEPFWRGARADTRKDDGTGLGLAIAFEVIRGLGGHWQASSRPEFCGFRLRWCLPG